MVQITLPPGHCISSSVHVLRKTFGDPKVYNKRNMTPTAAQGHLSDIAGKPWLKKYRWAIQQRTEVPTSYVRFLKPRRTFLGHVPSSTMAHSLLVVCSTAFLDVADVAGDKAFSGAWCQENRLIRLKCEYSLFSIVGNFPATTLQMGK